VAVSLRWNIFIYMPYFSAKVNKMFESTKYLLAKMFSNTKFCHI